MSLIDISKIMDGVLALQQIEGKINEYKQFHKIYLRNVRNRQSVLLQLSELAIKFQRARPATLLLINHERSKLLSDTETFLKQSLGDQILLLFKKQTPLPEPKNKYQNANNNFLLELLIILSQSFETVNEQGKQDWAYKTNFLTFLYDCIFHYGLHPDILRRSPDLKRYKVLMEHTFKSRGKKQIDCKIMMKPDVLYAEFLTPYEKKLGIRINGKIIPFASIYQIKITSTLLLDDEIELFAAKNKFTWTSNSKDDAAFVNCCADETEQLHKNPYLIEDKKSRFKNQKTYFVDPKRIEELSKVKSKKFDLVKLVQLCEELNNASSTQNFISSSLLARAIIDHVPPVFGSKNFSEVANSYTGGTRSFKKAMLNLDNSLRNIADNNIHSQMRSKEVLPTQAQVDFSQELDLLLSEVARILK